MESANDRALSAFGNEQDARTYKKAVKGKEGFLKKFGDDTDAVYHLAAADVPAFLEAAVARGDGVDTKVMLLYRG